MLRPGPGGSAGKLRLTDCAEDELMIALHHECHQNGVNFASYPKVIMLFVLQLV